MTRDVPGFYYEEWNALRAAWTPRWSREMPTSDKSGRLKKACGIGPRIRGVEAVMDRHLAMPLEDLKLIYGKTP